jgi:hypothetical protein
MLHPAVWKSVGIEPCDLLLAKGNPGAGFILFKTSCPFVAKMMSLEWSWSKENGLMAKTYFLRNL